MDRSSSRTALARTFHENRGSIKPHGAKITARAVNWSNWSNGPNGRRTGTELMGCPRWVKRGAARRLRERRAQITSPSASVRPVRRRPSVSPSVAAERRWWQGNAGAAPFRSLRQSILTRALFRPHLASRLCALRFRVALALSTPRALITFVRSFQCSYPIISNRGAPLETPRRSRRHGQSGSACGVAALISIRR